MLILMQSSSIVQVFLNHCRKKNECVMDAQLENALGNILMFKVNSKTVSHEHESGQRSGGLQGTFGGAASATLK